MDRAHSDALVFFGATGDLAYKKIFPGTAGHGKARALECAGDWRRQNAGWTIDAISRARAGQCGEAWRGGSRGFRETVVAYCATLTGDYDDPRRHSRRSARNSTGAKRPAYYLAIPPVSV